MTLSEKILYCRRRCGLSQEELAERIQVSRQAVSKWETGESLPEITKLQSLAKTFGVTTDWLLSDEEPYEPRMRADAESTEKPAAQPSKLEALPGILGKLVKRFGWLAGVYIAAGGLSLMLIGTLMLVMAKGIERSIVQMDAAYNFESFSWGGSEWSDVQWYDEAGNPVDAPSDIAGWDVREALGLPNTAKTPQSGMAGGAVSGIFVLFAGVVLGVGVLITAGGTVLAILLKRWGSAAAKA